MSVVRSPRNSSDVLTHRGRGKVDHICRWHFQLFFSWLKIFLFQSSYIECFPRIPWNNKLVQIMATNHRLNQWWTNLLTHMCVTRSWGVECCRLILEASLIARNIFKKCITLDFEINAKKILHPIHFDLRLNYLTTLNICWICGPSITPCLTFQRPENVQDIFWNVNKLLIYFLDNPEIWQSSWCYDNHRYHTYGMIKPFTFAHIYLPNVVPYIVLGYRIKSR